MGELWWQINREIMERFRPVFKSGHLPPMGIMMLRQLHIEPGLTVSELARRTGTAKSHVSKTVDQLLEQGLVEKRPDPDDQRLIRVFVTERAQAGKAEMEARFRDAWKAVITDLPDADVVQVESGLRILLEALKKADRSGASV
ncbi:MAG TPA: MarR family transcriptional regulator [Symbiobacteriaceae bacterium]|nr:MarR family transcriptional regulator [Symbiobacteriaceae bacterium]